MNAETINNIAEQIANTETIKWDLISSKRAFKVDGIRETYVKGDIAKLADCDYYTDDDETMIIEKIEEIVNNMDREAVKAELLAA